MSIQSRTYRHRSSISHARAAAALLLLLGALQHAVAGPMTTFSGSASGIFADPVGGTDNLGMGTGTFSWGTPVNPSAGDTKSSLQFAGNNSFSVTTPTGYIYGSDAQNNRPAFSLGTLTYVNGTTIINPPTDATGVTLKTTVSLTAPVATSPKDFPAALTLVTTPNTGTADQNADQVHLPKNLPPVVVTTAGGAAISIEPVGFGSITGDAVATTIDRFNVREGGTATANLLAKIASPCEPIVRNAVTPSEVAGGQTEFATFTPNFSLTLGQAAALCGYDHFNWVQTVTNDPYPPVPNDPALRPLTVPYKDPVTGGYVGSCADNLPFYWNEGGVCDSTMASYGVNVKMNPASLTGTFSDTPGEPFLTGTQYMGFTTDLVGVNADNSWDILYSWSWKSNYNSSGSGRAYRQALPEDNPPSEDPADGAAFDVQLDLNPWEIDPAVRALWTESGALNASNFVPEPGSILLVLLGLLALTGCRVGVSRGGNIQTARPVTRCRSPDSGIPRGNSPPSS